MADTILVTCRALSFLRPRLTALGFDPRAAAIQVPQGTSIAGLIAAIGLAEADVESVFLRHRITSRDTVLEDGDHLILVPPGTPGPHRYLLSIAPLPDSDLCPRAPGPTTYCGRPPKGVPKGHGK